MPTAGTNQNLATLGVDLASTQTRGRTWAFGLVLLVAAGIAAVANFNLVWNHFYDGVPMLFDTGWYAQLVYKSAPILQNPPTVAFATIGRDYYTTHFSPALWILSWPSYLTAVGPQIWLACLQAMEHAALALLTWLAVRRWAPDLTSVGHGAAAAVVMLAPFNGIELASMVYPHFESWFVVFGFGFLLALFAGRTRLAVIPFGLALLLREDMGFHLCGVLVLAALAARVIHGRWDRKIVNGLGFAAVGFVWSCVAIALMKRFFPGDDALSRVYLGSPPFAHLNWAEITGRLGFYATARGYIWMPIAVYLLWAIVSRCWWVLIGYLAFGPWLLLNFLAFSRAPGTMSLYYSFPFGLAILWPLAGHLIFGLDRRQPGVDLRVTWVVVALFVSTAGFIPEDGWQPLLRTMAVPATGTRTALHATVDRLAESVAHGGDVGIDDAVAALAPAEFAARNLFGQTPPKLVLGALYANGRQTRFAWDATRDLPLHYRVRGTPLVVLSTTPLDWPYLEMVSEHAGSILPFLRGPSAGWAPVERELKEGTRLLCAGPRDWYFRVGEAWTATFTLTIAARSEPADIVCEIVTQHGATVVARGRVKVLPGLDHAQRVTHELGFVIPENQNTGMEVRVEAASTAAVSLDEVVLRQSEPAPTDANDRGKV